MFNILTFQSPQQYSAWPSSVSEDTLTTRGSSLEKQAERRSWRGPEIPQGPPPQLPVSPSKFLAVEASTVLSTLQTIPEFAETMDLIDSVSDSGKSNDLSKAPFVGSHGRVNDLPQMCFALQDPASWSDVAGFELAGIATPPRHNQGGYGSHLQDTGIDSAGFTVHSPTALSSRDKNCAPFGLNGVTSLTPVNSSKPSQASIGRRRRRERGEPSPLCNRACASFLENISNSPKKTPTKSLPFTPSRVKEMCISFPFLTHPYPHRVATISYVCFPQFCNISGVDHLTLENPALTSTPVCGQRCLLNTPLQKETTPKHQKENDG